MRTGSKPTPLQPRPGCTTPISARLQATRQVGAQRGRLAPHHPIPARSIHDPLPHLPASPPAAFPSVSLTDGDGRVGEGEHKARSPPGDSAGGRVRPVTVKVRKWLLYLFPMLDCAPKDGGIGHAKLEAWLRQQEENAAVGEAGR
ncbi:hypothetical protein E2562_027898 [Oryza meyeriana var. granulata]|uniref:Uncharacterized protein n=1 Tax=Oryza meyeriana var. granulata TaxID=110450 RepID=A0A6G1CTT7_9ORYZ|nr:hypothetical protein E2562_027898 [Oryza meyeriana var. granulata]